MRISRQAAARLSTLVGSTTFDDLERHTFRSEELEVLPSEWQHLSIEPDLLGEMEGGAIEEVAL